MDMNSVRKNVKKLQKLFPKNRLIRHLEICALVYNCPAAKNFFLSRYEAPLPASPFCNARCLGCISYQLKNRCPVTQPRIKFIPSAQEISETALFHIKNVKDPVVSFGQGCEGEPLMVSNTLVKAIKIIRGKTSKGIINLNTNASKPKAVVKLFDAGLDSIRVSLNSVRKEYYNRYYKPRGYVFNDVLKSIKIANKECKFVSVNYLTMPGFTDSREEVDAFKNFLSIYRVNMIQWRNMNYDPLSYFRDLKIYVKDSELLGIKEVIKYLKKNFPKIMIGYFNKRRRR